MKEQRGETDRQAGKKHKDAAKEEEKTPQSETAETLIQREQTVEGQTATETQDCVNVTQDTLSCPHMSTSTSDSPKTPLD